MRGVVADVVSAGNQPFAELNIWFGTVPVPFTNGVTQGFEWSFVNLKTGASTGGYLYNNRLVETGGTSNIGTLSGFSLNLSVGNSFFVGLNGIGNFRCIVKQISSSRPMPVASASSNSRAALFRI